MQEENPSQKFEQQQDEMTPETVQIFNKVCQQATQLMLSYKQQSEDLKGQISSMVSIYNKNADPSDAVPLDKIIEITNVYEHEMRSAQDQYEHLQSQLKKEEDQRNTMIDEISLCFAKLEKMQKVLKAKKQKQAKQACQNQPTENEGLQKKDNDSN